MLGRFGRAHNFARTHGAGKDLGREADSAAREHESLLTDNAWQELILGLADEKKIIIKGPGPGLGVLIVLFN